MPAIARPVDEFPLFDPPPRRWAGPIVDAHMHALKPTTMQAYWDIAQPVYHITHAVAIVDLKTGIRLRRKYGPRVEPAVWGLLPRGDDYRDRAKLRKDKEAHLEKIANEGFKIVKLWFTPRFHEWHNLRMDDPDLDFFFDRIQKLNLSILVHVADPDYWFAHRISDLELHGSKAEHYLPLISRLQKYPDVLFQAAHLGGHPEDLDHLADLLERFPNLILDSSATKWIAREFSKHQDRARDFLIHHADRVVFGTDLVADPSREKEGKREHYASRFWVHQMMWEQKGRFDSPIEDADDVDVPHFYGLDLPPTILEKFYWKNAARVYRLEA